MAVILNMSVNKHIFESCSSSDLSNRIKTIWKYFYVPSCRQKSWHVRKIVSLNPVSLLASVSWPAFSSCCSKWSCWAPGTSEFRWIAKELQSNDPEGFPSSCVRARVSITNTSVPEGRKAAKQKDADQRSEESKNRSIQQIHLTAAKR